MTAPRSPFSEITPNLQIVWDSTSLGWLKTCPRLYYYKMILGVEHTGTKQALVFGLGFHGGCEEYDKLRIKGELHHEAQKQALRVGLLELGFHEEAPTCAVCGSLNLMDVDSSEGYCQDCLDTVSVETQKVWRRYDLDSYHSPEALARAIIWYTEQYKDDPFTTYTMPNGEPAVELSFVVPPGEQTQDGEELFLAGHIDRVVQDQSGNLWITDRKTAKQSLYSNYFDKYTPDNQMSLYATSGQLVLGDTPKGVIIDAIQKAVNFTRMARGYAPRTPAQLKEFIEDFKLWVFQAELYAKMDQWPMNDTSCDKFGGCPFRKICGQSPEMRDRYLSGPDFRSFNWNPLDKR